MLSFNVCIRPPEHSRWRTLSDRLTTPWIALRVLYNSPRYLFRMNMTVAPVTLPFQILVTSSSKVNIQQYKVMTTMLGARREEQRLNLDNLDPCNSCREHRDDSPATERAHRWSLSKLWCSTLSEIRSTDVKSAYPLDPSSEGDLDRRGTQASGIGEHCERAAGKGKECVDSYNRPAEMQ